MAVTSHRTVMGHFSELAVERPADLLMGRAPNPVRTSRGLVIGGGTVYPELNFTLPPMLVEAATMPEVERQYREIASDALKRAAELEIEGLVLEFEALPPMTENPEWGMAVVRILLDGIEEAHAKHGLLGALRVTPNDTREMVRPPRMRSGPLWDGMAEFFERSAEAGADFFSIESVGGKELSDDALMMCDVRGAIFALCVLGVRDMRFLWNSIFTTAERHGVIAAGDTACGFANTAMVLADKRMIPKVFAAVIRAVSAVRSLVAYECGAKGPGKDCGYENVILKAITGCPMSMEGKTAACAHASPVGNVAAAACDLWSNESVQNVRLLGGMAPTVSLEMLAYDCRLFNEAIAEGKESAEALQRWLVASDAARDPQALVLTPDSAVRIGRAIVSAPNPYRAGVAAARETLDLIEEAVLQAQLRIDARELTWIETIRQALDAMPDNENDFIAQMLREADGSLYRPAEYELAMEAHA